MTERETKVGEKYAQSPVTGQWYRVTKWEEPVDGEGGRIIARQKEEIDESEVPDEVLGHQR